jgi:micrococcal nuclease
VHYKSGPSKAQGLTPQTADGAGNATWSWIVGTNTTPGSWPIDVLCGTASARTTFVVQ